MKIFGRSIPLLAIVAIVASAGMVSAVLVEYLSNTVTADVTVKSPMEVGISLGRESWATAQCYRPAYERDDGNEIWPNPGAEISDWGYASCDADKGYWTNPTYTTKEKDKCKTDGFRWYETGGKLANAPYTGGYVDSFPEGVDVEGAHISDRSPSDWVTTGTLVMPAINGGETLTLYTMSVNLADAEIKGRKELIVSHPTGIAIEDFVSVKVRTDSIYGELGYGKQYPRPDGGGPLQLCKRIDGRSIQLLWPCDLDGKPDTWGAGETDVSQWTITFKPAASGTYTFTYRIVPE